MHCPYCAQPLRLRDGVLYCDAGEDEFSVVSSALLLHAAEGDPRAVPALEAEAVTRWHCPRCAARMRRTPGKPVGAQCARCGFEMRASLEHGLVELRTHPYAEEERAELDRVLRG